MPLYISNGCRLASRLAVTSVYLTAERNANLSSRLNGQDKQPLVLQLATPPHLTLSHPFSLLLPFSFGRLLSRQTSFLARHSHINLANGKWRRSQGAVYETLNLTLVIASNAPLGMAGNWTLCSEKKLLERLLGKTKSKNLKADQLRRRRQSEELTHPALQKQRLDWLASELAWSTVQFGVTSLILVVLRLSV